MPTIRSRPTRRCARRCARPSRSRPSSSRKGCRRSRPPRRSAAPRPPRPGGSSLSAQPATFSPRSRSPAPRSSGTPKYRSIRSWWRDSPCTTSRWRAARSFATVARALSWQSRTPVKSSTSIPAAGISASHPARRFAPLASKAPLTRITTSPRVPRVTFIMSASHLKELTPECVRAGDGSSRRPNEAHGPQLVGLGCARGRGDALLLAVRSAERTHGRPDGEQVRRRQCGAGRRLDERPDDRPQPAAEHEAGRGGDAQHRHRALAQPALELDLLAESVPHLARLLRDGAQRLVHVTHLADPGHAASPVPERDRLAARQEPPENEPHPDGEPERSHRPLAREGAQPLAHVVRVAAHPLEPFLHVMRDLARLVPCLGPDPRLASFLMLRRPPRNPLVGR